MANSSNSSKDLGNTKPSPSPGKTQIPPSKKWCFTLNNYTIDECSSIVPILKENCSKWIIAKEIGEECGTPHLQGFIEFKTKARPTAVFSFTKRISWHKAKGNYQDQLNYIGSVLKNKTSQSEVWEQFGMPELELPPDTITKDEFYDWQKDCYDIYLQKPDHRRIYWFWSKAGLTGKTEMVRFLNINHSVPFSYGGAVADIMNLAFNNMKGCKAFVFALTRKKGNRISYDALEQLKDGLISNNKYETGCFTINRPHVFIFANAPPDDDPEELFMSKDRFVIKEITG